MNKIIRKTHPVLAWLSAAAILFLSAGAIRAQQFDFEQLHQEVKGCLVIIDMDIEISFGVHTTEQQQRYLGTVVSEDGLIMFNGIDLASEGGLTFSNFGVKTDPTRIEVITLEGETFEGEFLGVDRFTRIGFVRVAGAPENTFKVMKFETGVDFKVGRWLSLYMLLPDIISPPLAADVGMISNLVTTPEEFPLTVGFNALQLGSVLFDENLKAVGLLGTLIDPSLGGEGGMGDAFGQFGLPLLGVVTGERLQKIIADPPKRGKIDRGWLGIRLQALTSDIAEFWGLDATGGIIVNEIVTESPAALAGLKVGDIVLELNDEPIDVDRDENLAVFQRNIAEMGPGASLELTVARPAGKEVSRLKLVAHLQKAPMDATDAPEYESESLEFKVRDLVFDDYMFYNEDPQTFKGVFVSELKQGGLAEIGGLSFGDVIQRIGSEDVEVSPDVRRILEGLEQQKSREVIFFVWRNNKTLFVNVKTDWQ